MAELHTESGFISLSSGSSGTELSMYAYDIEVLSQIFVLSMQVPEVPGRNLSS